MILKDLDMYNIAAYITAYEDINAIKKCIATIKNQSYPIKKIYIVDNSTLPVSEHLDNHSDIIFEHYPENIGIAKGLNKGIAWSIQENYDFLWTFDQDSEPMPNALSSLIETYEKLIDNNANPGIVACLPIDQKTGYELHGLVFNYYRFTKIDQSERQNNFYECDIVITSGSLMAVSALKDLLRIDDDLFIDAVDWDLCLKLKENSYRVYVDQNSILNHRYGASYEVVIPILRKKIVISSYSALRYYHICRNQTFIETRYAVSQSSLIFSVIYRLSNAVKKVIKIMIFDQEGMLLKICAVLKGTLDGLYGRLERRWF